MTPIAKNQKEFDALLEKGVLEIEVQGDEWIELRNAKKVVITKGKPHVEAWGSSQPHVEARGSSQPHVVARESSQPHVEAWGSSQPHVEAWGYTMLSLKGEAIKAKQGKSCHAVLHLGASVKGGSYQVVDISTPKLWAEYYGLEVERGRVLVYKAVSDKFMSPRGASYAPGETLVAKDWDGGEAECGGGLHFSPSPRMAKEFNEGATKFVGCWVKLSECRAVKKTDNYPQKIKAKGVCRPCFEVDVYGKPVK